MFAKVGLFFLYSFHQLLPFIFLITAIQTEYGFDFHFPDIQCWRKFSHIPKDYFYFFFVRYVTLAFQNGCLTFFFSLAVEMFELCCSLETSLSVRYIVRQYYH